MNNSDIQNSGKLNRLLRAWPKDGVVVQRWLTKQGVSRVLAQAYCTSGWLERVGHGAYIRVGDSANWLGAVSALQTQLDLTVHPAAKTALELKGRAHYLPLGDHNTVWLFADSGEKLPAWFLKREWGPQVRFTATNLFPSKSPGLSKHDLGGYDVLISAPERAALELVHLVPKELSYDETKRLFEGLTTLRPNPVQQLLEQCRSIKAKRLFMYLSEVVGHGWVKKLDLSNVDFGRGKRVIVKGGALDTRYQISVPDSRDQETAPLVSA